jgi:hypothetical protein
MAQYQFIMGVLGLANQVVDDFNVIEIQGASKAGGAPLDWHTLTGDDNQLWEFVPDSGTTIPSPSGYYYIRSKLNGNVITVAEQTDPLTLAPAPLVSAPLRTTGTLDQFWAQLWAFLPDPLFGPGSGYNLIQSALPGGNVIDIQGVSAFGVPDAPSGLAIIASAYRGVGASIFSQEWGPILPGIELLLPPHKEPLFPPPPVPVALPPSGLKSNSNYVLFSDKDIPLLDLRVIIRVTQDLVSTDGFSFQLNALPPDGFESISQQYAIACLGSGFQDLTAFVQIWHSFKGPFLNDSAGLGSLKTANRLPAGYQLEISLVNGPDGTVTAVNFLVIDNHGKTQANHTINISEKSNGQVARAPIVAFQFNVVGPDNKSHAEFLSGAAVVTYVAQSPLLVSNNQPADTTSIQTDETSNSFYSQLPVGSPSGTVTQFVSTWPLALYTANGRQKLAGS